MTFHHPKARRVGTVPEGESRTKQSFGHEADVNVIVGRYLRSGDASIFNQRVGSYGDVSGVSDYQSCLEVIRSAEASFRTLPAKVRDHFKNDPGELVAALGDPARRAELEGLGIVRAATDVSTAASAEPSPAAQDAQSSTKSS